MDKPGPKQDFLVLSRGRWNEDASPEQVQDAIDRFYNWYELGLEQGRMKRGSRLEAKAVLVSKASVTDGPFTEAKEVIGGFWFIVAGSLDEAASIAAENPCLDYGLQLEVRPLDAERASVRVPANETPAGWRSMNITK